MLAAGKQVIRFDLLAFGLIPCFAERRVDEGLQFARVALCLQKVGDTPPPCGERAVSCPYVEGNRLGCFPAAAVFVEVADAVHCPCAGGFAPPYHVSMATLHVALTAQRPAVFAQVHDRLRVVVLPLESEMSLFPAPLQNLLFVARS